MATSCAPVENITAEEVLRREIHEANIEKLKGMSREEILTAKSYIEHTLSPDILNFLKSKTKILEETKFHETPNDRMESDDGTEAECLESMIGVTKATDQDKGDDASGDTPTKMDCDIEPLEKDVPAMELAEVAAAKGWMHMDTIEPEKLEWTKDVLPKKTEESAPDEPYNARFDFNGVLLPFCDDRLTVDKGLHHHGEEPDRPGYSLQELLQLSRSSNQQQRCTALATLANIIEKSRHGWYDKVLEPAPLVALSETNILLLLRFALDDTSIAVVAATLQALRAFLYSEADEICLDRLVGWHYPDGKVREPELSAPKTDIGDTSNMKDHELAQLDAVAVAIRSDIVLRLRYYD